MDLFPLSTVAPEREKIPQASSCINVVQAGKFNILAIFMYVYIEHNNDVIDIVCAVQTGRIK